MKATFQRILTPLLLAVVAGGAPAAILSSDAGSLIHRGACGDGNGGAWILVYEPRGLPDGLRAVTAWHAPRDGEPRRVGRIALHPYRFRLNPLDFAECRTNADGVVAYVQSGWWLEVHALTAERTWLLRRIDLIPLCTLCAARPTTARQRSNPVRVQFVAGVGGRLLIGARTLWLETDGGLKIVRQSDDWSPMSYSADEEHLYYVEPVASSRVALSSRGGAWNHPRRVRLVQERVDDSGLTRTAESDPLDVPVHSPNAGFRARPDHLTMADSQRVHMLTYLGGSGRFILRTGALPPDRGGQAPPDASRAARTVARIDLGEQADVRFRPGSPTVASWTKMGSSLHVAHVKRNEHVPPIWTMLMIRVASDGASEVVDLPLPPELQASFGLFWNTPDLVVSGDRLFAISTVVMPSTEKSTRGRTVVSIDRIR